MGKKKIGIAISDPSHKIVTPFEVLKKNKYYLKELLLIINDFNVGGILIGLPKTDNDKNKMCQMVRDLGVNIDKFLSENNFDLPIFFWDESYTSFEAEEITKDFFRNTKEQNKHIDKFAAKLMLDDFFNENLDEKKITESLHGINVFDLTRVLAGPTSTQILGDLGANVIKVERPNSGDDSRNLGPPYLDNSSEIPQESSYYLSVNRNKQSVTIDLTKKEGQMLAKKIIKKCDVLVENFRAGNLKQYGLDYKSVKKINPKIIYCSITGFGQTGPYSKRGGYDYLVQAMGGIMSITGEKKGQPTKIGVGVSDIITGLYACISILSALKFRDVTSLGQHIDISLMDSQVAWLSYVAQGYLTSGITPQRIGNDHPSIVPYQTVKAKNGLMVLAIANDRQFKSFCNFSGLKNLHLDPKYKSNSQRVKNRNSLNKIINKTIKVKSISYWVSGLTKVNVPCGPINDISQVFKDPQVKSRNMKIKMKHKKSKQKIDLIASPMKFSVSNIKYKKPPPTLGEDTELFLKKFLKISASDLKKLKLKKII